MARGNAEVDNRRTDTRERILSVALRLFASQGYTNTSLREIADELGVTKAALYFHFKTKEEILHGILGDHLDNINAIVDDAESDMSTPASREDLLRRLAEYQATRSQHLVRLIRENFSQVSTTPFGTEVKKAQHRSLNALAGPNPTLMDRIRARTAFAALQTAAMSAEWEDVEETDVREAALTVALEVLRGGQR